MSEILSHPIPAVVILLGLLVFVHEFGHFIVGRLSGIAVETFSLGFGPKIISVNFRGTEYRLSWIPLGGYVKFAGAHPAESIPAGLPGRPFRETPLPLRAATILAGPAANFVMAVVVYAILGASGIPHPPPSIGEVIDGSPAEAAGIRHGDVFTSIDGKPTTTWRDIESKIASSPGQKLTITVKRGEGETTLELTPAKVDTTDILGKPVSIGRAGIALGMQPPIITVTKPDSPAAKAGLVTGDRIDAVTIAGERRDIKSYADLEVAFRDANQSNAGLVLHASTTTPTKSDVGTSPRDVTIEPGVPLAKDFGLHDSQLTVAEAKEGAKEALQPGDWIAGWNGAPVRDLYDLTEKLLANTSPTARVKVVRGGTDVESEINLTPVDVQKPEGLVTMYRLPVIFWAQPEDPEPVIEKYDGLISAVGYGISETGRQTAELGGTLVRLFTGDIPLKALGGPMLIAKVAGDSARHGWQTFLASMALISINLGLINLFPIPVLDGGQLVLMAAEGVKRRPLRETAIENFQKVGFAMIMALVVLSTYNDLSRFWKSMLASVAGLFQ